MWAVGGQMQSKRQRLGLLKQRRWRNERQAQPQRADPAIFFEVIVGG